MKYLSKLLLVSLVVVAMACSNDDNSGTTPTTITSQGTIDWNSFNPANTNITSLVTFNGQPASTYTVNAIKGDRVTFEFNIGSKSNAKVTRELFMVRIDTTSGATTQEAEFIYQHLRPIQGGNPNYPDYISGFEVLESAPDEIEVKFDILVTILEDGNFLPADYLIDPKIKIRTKR